MELPITPEALLTVFGIAALGSLVTEWLKRYIKKELVINLLCLALCLAFALLARAILSNWHPSATELLSALLVGFSGASLATFGYESLKNLLALVESGP